LTRNDLFEPLIDPLLHFLPLILPDQSLAPLLFLNHLHLLNEFHVLIREDPSEVLLELSVLVLVKFKLHVQVVHLVLEDHEVRVERGLVWLVKKLSVERVHEVC